MSASVLILWLAGAVASRTAAAAATAGFAIALALIVLALIAKRFVYIARPSQALVFSGKSHRAADGSLVGYRVIQQGHRGFRVPILERVDLLDMRLLPIDILVNNAYSRGNIPLKIHAIANVKLHSNPQLIGNAIERFLGRDLKEVQTVAQQTLEGAVREVIATLTPEEVNEDRLKFAESLIAAAEDDLHKLGLQLDTLKIQNVSDDTGYLDSLGRPQIAAALRDAQNAENEAQQVITRAQAESQRRAEVSKATAETSVLSKRNELRRVQAELDGVVQQIDQTNDILRALVKLLVSEFNRHADKTNALLDAIDASNSLATLKSAVAGINNHPTRTLKQLRSAIRAELGS